VIEDGPWFDHIVDCNDNTAGSLYHLVKALRKLKPDMAVIMPNSFRSALVARLSGAKHVVGYKRNGRSFLISSGPRPVQSGSTILPVPMVTYYMEICKYLNINAPVTTKPSLFISDALNKKGEKLFDTYKISSDDMVVGLNPGAKFGASKCWPPEHFAKLAEMLQEAYNCKILILTGPGEEKIAGLITENSRATLINTAKDSVDLALLKCLIKRCNLLVTNDTGPRHYAVAFNIPTLVIMGPTDPRYTDANLENTFVLRIELDCSPCHKSRCPLNHECMRMITPENVMQESNILLERSHNR
jgi:heptosyltransferase-2